MLHCLLPDRALIAVTGGDARAFLQGLVTNDVNRVSPDRLVYTLLLTPQGRFLHDFFMIDWPKGVLLDVRRDRADDLLKRLKLYKLRREVEISPVERQITASWGDAPFAGALPDPRLPALGWRAYEDNFNLTDNAATPEAYDAHRISLGVPDGVLDMTVEKSLALDFGMDDLCGVDFNKGCYVGQEVTARMHYKATPKRGVYIATTSGGDLPEKGTEVLRDGEKAGEMCSSSGAAGLALLKHDLALNDDGTMYAGSFSANGVALAVTRPGWAKRLPSD